MTSRQTLGQRGEQLAANYLKRQGYTILMTNWRCSQGEIDIIARQEKTLVLVEVRTRRSGLEDAFASIGPRKRAVLERMAYLYLAEHDLAADTDWRIDVIAVTFTAQTTPQIEHIEDALDW